MGQDFQSLMVFIESIGIVAFAISGMILAKKKNLDIVGIFIIGWVTAFGGGIIRDIMLDINPMYWISHPEYPVILLILAMVMSMIRNVTIKETWLLIPDAMGMSLFAITTAQTAVSMNIPIIIVGILSTIVASFGGVIRDSLCQEIPIIFRQSSTLYASLAFCGGVVYSWLVMNHFLDENIALLSCIGVVFVLRVIAFVFGIRFRAFFPTR